MDGTGILEYVSFWGNLGLFSGAFNGGSFQGVYPTKRESWVQSSSSKEPWEDKKPMVSGLDDDFLDYNNQVIQFVTFLEW